MEENKETKTTSKKNTTKKTTITKTVGKPVSAKNNKSKTNQATKKPNSQVKKTTAKTSSNTTTNNYSKKSIKKTNPSNKKINNKPNVQKKAVSSKTDKEKNENINKTESKKEIIVETTIISEDEQKENIANTLIFNGIPQEEKKKTNLDKTIIFDVAEKKNIADVVKKLEEENIVVENKVLKRSKVKKVVIIIVTLIMIALVAGTIYYVIDSQKIAHDNNLTIGSDIYKKVTKKYKSVSQIDKKPEGKSNIQDLEYSNIETLTLGEFEEKAYSKEDMTIIISSATCYSCLTFEPVLNESLSTLEKIVYRINITNLTTNEKERFRTYYAFSATPTMFKVKDGKVTADYKGIMSSEEITDWLTKA